MQRPIQTGRDQSGQVMARRRRCWKLALDDFSTARVKERGIAGRGGICKVGVGYCSTTAILPRHRILACFAARTLRQTI